MEKPQDGAEVSVQLTAPLFPGVRTAGGLGPKKK